MAEIGTAKITIDPDLGRLTLVMRVLAKHLTACADELEAGNTKPKVAWHNGKPRPWGADEVGRAIDAEASR